MVLILISLFSQVAGVFDKQLWFQLDSDGGKISFWKELSDYEAALKLGIFKLGTKIKVDPKSTSITTSQQHSSSSQTQTQNTPSFTFIPPTSIREIVLPEMIVRNLVNEKQANIQKIAQNLAEFEENVNPQVDFTQIVNAMLDQPGMNDEIEIQHLLSFQPPGKEERMKQATQNVTEKLVRSLQETGRRSCKQFPIYSIRFGCDDIKIILEPINDGKGVSIQNIVNSILQSFNSEEQSRKVLLDFLTGSSISIKVIFRGYENYPIYCLNEAEINKIRHKLSFLTSNEELELYSNLFKLQQAALFCDTKLMALDNSSISCHKVIVYARCPVLQENLLQTEALVVSLPFFFFLNIFIIKLEFFVDSSSKQTGT